MWSDESPYVLRFNRRTQVWRTASEKFEPFALRGSVKHDTKIMVWGCFSAHGIGPLHRIEGIMNAEGYARILDQHLIRTFRKFWPRNRRRQGVEWTFQQDNDPKHVSRVATEWFEDHQVRVLPWPAQSPDLNPIENLWSILDYRTRNRHPRNGDELFQALETEWNDLPLDLLEDLVSSMPRRVEAVIQAKGGPTKY